MAVKKRMKSKGSGNLKKEAETNKRFMVTLAVIGVVFVIGFIILQYAT
ncbi:MAG: hypothetical protein H0U74_05935 [Bradymonadaceae bacterium]|nr:hypothetical protein [Lujinxingiaceae bacterium]